ncbi:MAG: Uncharacterised protein [Alphaproteobacteria bacterium]|nr:MAG: Uncharacterised protein [Alphaproteobacteria bacterium]
MAKSMLKIMKTTRLIAVAGFGLILSGCLGLGNNIDEVVQRQCPTVAVLTTADVLVVDGLTVEISKAELKCFINLDEEDELLASVTLSGRGDAKRQVPLFLAALDDKDVMTGRTQYRVTFPAGPFSIKLPNMAYGKKGDGQKPRLVAGFVLTQAQLEANRAAYRKKLGLGD